MLFFDRVLNFYEDFNKLSTADCQIFFNLNFCCEYSFFYCLKTFLIPHHSKKTKKSNFSRGYDYKNEYLTSDLKKKKKNTSRMCREKGWIEAGYAAIVKASRKKHA